MKLYKTLKKTGWAGGGALSGGGGNAASRNPTGGRARWLSQTTKTHERAPNEVAQNPDLLLRPLC